MIREVCKPDGLKRDKKAGWTARRHFYVKAENEAAARAEVDKDAELGSCHPWSPLMILERIEFKGRDDETGEWKFDGVYWLPRGRKTEIEAMAARST